MIYKLEEIPLKTVDPVSKKKEIYCTLENSRCTPSSG